MQEKIKLLISFLYNNMCTYTISSHTDIFEIQITDSEESLSTFVNLFPSCLCERGIENSVPRIAVWHHDAYRGMSNGDPRNGVFYSLLTQIMNFCSCSLLYFDLKISPLVFPSMLK